MTKEDDHLANEVSVSAKLEDRGIAAAAKSRAVAAFDRLLGSALDIPTAYLERISASARLRGEIEREKLIEEQKATTDLDQLFDGDPYLLAKLAEDKAKTLENISKIVDRSVGALSEGDSSVVKDGDLDEEWLDRFRLYAKEVTSETMQGLWGRVLAGEILNPSSFSLSTLRFFSEVDKHIAEMFQNSAKTVFIGQFIPKSPSLTGQLLLDFGSLEDAGLVRDVGGSIGINFESNDDGKITLREEQVLLIAESKDRIRLPVIPLTRIGKDLLKILPKPDPRVVLEAAFECLDSENVTSAKIVVILEEFANGDVRCADVVQLKAQGMYR